MSNCARLSERMPGIALGRSMWTAEEVNHLRDCLDCQDEWSVVQRSASLGSDLAGDLDSTATARVVLQLPLPELDSLRPGELNAVLQTLEQPNMGDSTDSSAADDLDDGVLDGGYDPLEG